MQRQPLPKQVDARKFASIGSEIHATLAVADLPRFSDGLASNAGQVEVDLHFYRDEQGLFRLDGKLAAEVELVCQRCLGSMPSRLDADMSLAIVWTEEQAAALPKRLDGIIVGEEALALAEIIQDELIISTPFVVYHEIEDCPVQLAGDEEQRDDGAPDDASDNPFAILGRLRSPD